MCRIILSSVACLVMLYSHTLTQKCSDLKKNVTEHKICVLTFSTNPVENMSHSKKNSARYYHECTRRHVQYPLFLSRVQRNLNFLDRFSKNIKIPNYMKIRRVGAELFHAGRTDTEKDRQTDVTIKLSLFANFLRTGIRECVFKP